MTEIVTTFYSLEGASKGVALERWDFIEPRTNPSHPDPGHRWPFPKNNPFYHTHMYSLFRAEAIFKQLDSNGDGSLDEEEFCKWITIHDTLFSELFNFSGLLDLTNSMLECQKITFIFRGCLEDDNFYQVIQDGVNKLKNEQKTSSWKFYKLFIDFWTAKKLNLGFPDRAAIKDNRRQSKMGKLPVSLSTKLQIIKWYNLGKVTFLSHLTCVQRHKNIWS